MLKNINQELKIQWENYTIVNEWEVKNLVETNVRRVSNKMITVILSNNIFRMGKYFSNEENKFKIGYGYGDPDNPLGLTEDEAFSLWIEELKRKEKILRKQLPIPFIEQTKFDALLSLYFLTGTWKKVEGNLANYDTAYAVKTLNWELLANMLCDAKINNDQRRKEARVLMLGDYNTEKDRRVIRTEGTQFERNRYSLSSTDMSIKNQIENAYYRQIGGFLPGMTDLQKRKVMAKNRIFSKI
jgi:hypothetical protein